MKNIKSVKMLPTERREEREGEILDAAWRLITDKGYTKTTMADLAATLGISEGSLYNYFPSKKNVGISVAERWFVGRTHELEKMLLLISSPYEQLQLIIRNHLDGILQERELHQMWMRELRATLDYGDSESRNIFRSYTDLLKIVLKSLHDTGKLNCAIPKNMFRDVIYGGVEHVAWTTVIQNRTTDFDISQSSENLARGYWAMLTGSSDIGTEANEKQLDRIENMLKKLSAAR